MFICIVPDTIVPFFGKPMILTTTSGRPPGRAVLMIMIVPDAATVVRNGSSRRKRAAPARYSGLLVLVVLVRPVVLGRGGCDSSTGWLAGAACARGTGARRAAVVGAWWLRKLSERKSNKKQRPAGERATTSKNVRSSLVKK